MNTIDIWRWWHGSGMTPTIIFTCRRIGQRGWGIMIAVATIANDPRRRASLELFSCCSSISILINDTAFQLMNFDTSIMLLLWGFNWLENVQFKTNSTHRLSWERETRRSRWWSIVSVGRNQCSHRTDPMSASGISSSPWLLRLTDRFPFQCNDSFTDALLFQRTVRCWHCTCVSWLNDNFSRFHSIRCGCDSLILWQSQFFSLWKLFDEKSMKYDESYIHLLTWFVSYRLIELTLGTLSESQMPSAIRRSRISQANIVGAWPL